MDDNTLWEKWNSKEEVTLEDIKNSLRNSLHKNIIRYYLDSSLEYSGVNELLNRLIQNLESVSIVNYDDNLETQIKNIETEVNETIENLLKDYFEDILEIYLYEMFDYSLIEPNPDPNPNANTCLPFGINDEIIATRIDEQVKKIDRFCGKIIEIARVRDAMATYEPEPEEIARRGAMATDVPEPEEKPDTDGGETDVEDMEGMEDMKQSKTVPPRKGSVRRTTTFLQKPLKKISQKRPASEGEMSHSTNQMRKSLRMSVGE